jgi:hypothetical protein
MKGLFYNVQLNIFIRQRNGRLTGFLHIDDLFAVHR